MFKTRRKTETDKEKMSKIPRWMSFLKSSDKNNAKKVEEKADAKNEDVDKTKVEQMSKAAKNESNLRTKTLVTENSELKQTLI